MTDGPRRRITPPAGQVVQTIRTGTSGAVVTILRRDDGLIAVKTADTPRVSAIQQSAARNSIAPLFGDERLPRVLFAGEHDGKDVLVTECPTATTLADLSGSAARPSTEGFAVWTDLLETLHTVWTRSARPGFVPELATRNHGLRCERAVHALRWAFARLGLSQAPWCHLVVNDVDCGPLDGILARLATIPPPAVHVACHGDPQPRNVLVTDDGAWYLVDWEWAGWHQDWRMMCSHLIGWWHVESVLESGRGAITASSSAVHLHYQPPLVEHLGAWIEPAFRLFCSFTAPDRLEQDTRALATHVAMLLVREIPKAMQTDRGYLVAPLLGEAIRLITTSEVPEFFACRLVPASKQ